MTAPTPKPKLYGGYKLRPELVVIDGRFRVACFLASCVSTTRPLQILIDDYCDRPNYQVIERFAKPSERVDRMAVFDVEPGMVGPEALLHHLEAFYRPGH